MWRASAARPRAVAEQHQLNSVRHQDRDGHVVEKVAAKGSGGIQASLVFLLYQKGRDSRIFQAYDRAIDDFVHKGKTRN
jgi:hypothetical protein